MKQVRDGFPMMLVLIYTAMWLVLFCGCFKLIEKRHNHQREMIAMGRV